jgi:hypothetical protein
VFTGDTGPSEAISALAKGGDLLISKVNSVEEFKAEHPLNTPMGDIGADSAFPRSEHTSRQGVRNS